MRDRRLILAFLAVPLAIGAVVGGCTSSGRGLCCARPPERRAPGSKSESALWTQQEVERRTALACKIWDSRRPKYLARYLRLHVGVTSLGKEYVDSSMIRLQRRMAADNPQGGHCVGTILPHET